MASSRAYRLNGRIRKVVSNHGVERLVNGVGSANWHRLLLREFLRGIITNNWGETNSTFFPKQFTVRGSQCFKEMVALVLDGLVGFPAGLVFHFLSFVSQFFSFVSQAGCLLSGSRLACLPKLGACGRVPGWSPTSFHLSPTSFHLSPSSFHLSPRLGACGRVPGWLVSHFLSFVSHFFSFVRAGWLVSHVLFLFVSHFFLFVICFPVLFICLPGWVLVVGFPAGLFPTSFICLPGWALPFICLPLLFTCLPVLFICLPRLWSGSRLACLRLPFICLPLLFNCLPLLFIVSQAECFWSGSRPFPLAIWCPPFSADVRPFPLAM